MNAWDSYGERGGPAPSWHQEPRLITAASSLRRTGVRKWPAVPTSPVSAPQGATNRETGSRGRNHEIHHLDVRVPAGLRRDGGQRRSRGAGLVRGRLRGDGLVHGVVRQGPGRIRGTGRRAGPDRPGAHPQDPAAGRRSGGDRRPLRRDRGGPGRLLARRLRQLRPGHRDRRPADDLSRARARPGPRLRGRPAGRRVPRRARALTVGRTEAGDLLRQLAPQVLGALVRRYGHFDAAEDAVQEARRAAPTQWPAEGVPGNPRGWLITVASRRLTDLLRSEQARQRREETAARWELPRQ